MSTQQAPAGTAPYVMGVDIGSTTSKCVILDSTGNILADVIITVGTGTSGPERALTEALDSAGLTREDISVRTPRSCSWAPTARSSTSQ